MPVTGNQVTLNNQTIGVVVSFNCFWDGGKSSQSHRFDQGSQGTIDLQQCSPPPPNGAQVRLQVLMVGSVEPNLISAPFTYEPNSGGVCYLIAGRLNDGHLSGPNKC
ncbi:MAG: hypothetical protein KDA88_20990 [Planctomycetaceae bacterium]|nr:hypothetical protein [Planctomycetaceae bacterium]MCB9949761.1 hypothetical protein [Planctomycetaceae bacterium]